MFSMLNSTEHEISTAHKIQILKNKDHFAFKLADVVIIMPLNVQIEIIVS